MATLFEENLCCSVCRDVFRDPVLLMCSHSFCKTCLGQYWQHTELQACPLCRTSCSVENPPRNLALKNLCEAFIQERFQRASAGSELCGVHKNKVMHFCLQDKQLVCEMCHTSTTHTDTNCLKQLDEAAVDLKLDLKRKLGQMKEKLEQFKMVKQTCVQIEDHIKRQAHQAEAVIKRDFEKLRHFLCEEEASRIAALRKEEEQKSQTVKKKIAQTNRDVLFLSEKVKVMEEGLEASNISFLQQNYKVTVGRTQCNLKNPEILSGVLIDVAKHLGNLSFRVWEKMQSIAQYAPVILDPNTAHPCLHLSEDLNGMILCDHNAELPANPERFDDYVGVLGSEGLDSGTHSWDVEVGDSSIWAVGVISESAFKHRENLSKKGLWHLGYYKGEYGKGLSEMLTPFRMKQKLQKIRVQLDWDRGHVSFFNPDDNTHVHTFTHTFTEPVYPYLYNACTAQALRILPIQGTINNDQCDI